MTRGMNCWVLLKTHSYTMRKIIQRIVSAFHLNDITGLGPTSRLIKTPHHPSITRPFTRNLSHDPVACLPCAGAMLTCTCRVILAQGRCLPAHANTPSNMNVFFTYIHTYIHTYIPAFLLTPFFFVCTCMFVFFPYSCTHIYRHTNVHACMVYIHT